MSLPTILPVTATRSPMGRLHVGGCDLVELAERYGTALYCCDEATLDEARSTIRRALQRWPADAHVAYAAKAWLNTSLLRWLAAKGLGLDVVSEGELRYALHARFPARAIHLHGNLKSEAALRLAVRRGIGRIVLDHEAEVEQLEGICAAEGRRQAVWLRLNPATSVASHAHVITGEATSKFGLSLADGSATRVARQLSASPHLDWRGVHFHLGSQMRQVAPIHEATARVLAWLRPWRQAGWRCAEFSPGAGWYVPYRPTEQPLDPREVVSALVEAFRAAEWPAPWPTLIVEPGRELVARAVIALYTVGALKQAGERHYAFVDGGLGDNPRPALYGAQYHALLANRESGATPQPVVLAGPFCESGDAWPEVVPLPPLQVGDLLAVPMSGAYQLSMASTYNGVPRPAVLWLRQGEAVVVQRRERYEALWARDADGSRIANGK